MTMVHSGPHLIKGGPLREALHASHADFFGGRQLGMAVILGTGPNGPEDIPGQNIGFADGLKKYGASVGVMVDEVRAPQSAIPGLLAKIPQGRPWIRGLVVADPLPDVSAEGAVHQAIPPLYDVDGVNMFSPFYSRKPTPSAMLYAAEHAFGPGDGIAEDELGCQHVVVVGAAGRVGRSLVARLVALGVTQIVTIDRDNKEDLPEAVRQGAVIFSAANQPGIITAEMLKGTRGKLVVDAAIVPTEKGVVGNVDPAVYTSGIGHLAVTPVPGGVGMINRPMVFQNLRHAVGLQDTA